MISKSRRNGYSSLLPRMDALSSEAQKIAAEDLPYLPMWFGDAVSVHRKDLGDLALSPSGDLDFLEKLQIQN